MTAGSEFDSHGIGLPPSSLVSFSSDICVSSADASSKITAPTISGSVRCVNPVERQGWDALLASHPGSTFFQSVAWAKVLRETYGCDPVYFTVTEGARLLALLPVMEVNSRLTGRRGIALPFTDVCDPLDQDSLLANAVIPKMLEYGRERGWNSFECRGGKDLFRSAPAFQSFWAHELKLFKDDRYLFARLESSTRRAVRKAEKLGVRTEISQSLEALQKYYSLHCKTRKRHGLPPQPFTFFLNIYEHILSQNKGIVVLARHEENLIAGAIYFQFGEQAIYKFGASDEAFQDFRGNNLVMWAGIRWFASKGVKLLHFGRTSVANEGLRRFKLGWGAEERRIDYVRYNLRNNRYEIGTDRAIGGHNQVFRRLPVFVLRLLGAALYRHMA